MKLKNNSIPSKHESDVAKVDLLFRDLAPATSHLRYDSEIFGFTHAWFANSESPTFYVGLQNNLQPFIGLDNELSSPEKKILSGARIKLGHILDSLQTSVSFKIDKQVYKGMAAENYRTKYSDSVAYTVLSPKKQDSRMGFQEKSSSKVDPYNFKSAEDFYAASKKNPAETITFYKATKGIFDVVGKAFDVLYFGLGSDTQRK